MRKTRKQYERYLNEIGECLDEEKFIVGGKMRRGKYGTMMRKHDPVCFNVGYSEYVMNER